MDLAQTLLWTSSWIWIIDISCGIGIYISGAGDIIHYDCCRTPRVAPLWTVYWKRNQTLIFTTRLGSFYYDEITYSKVGENINNDVLEVKSFFVYGCHRVTVTTEFGKDSFWSCSKEEKDDYTQPRIFNPGVAPTIPPQVTVPDLNVTLRADPTEPAEGQMIHLSCSTDLDDGVLKDKESFLWKRNQEAVLLTSGGNASFRDNQSALFEHLSVNTSIVQHEIQFVARSPFLDNTTWTCLLFNTSSNTVTITVTEMTPGGGPPSTQHTTSGLETEEHTEEGNTQGTVYTTSAIITGERSQMPPMSTGYVAVIVVGVIFGIVVALIVTICIFRKRKRDVEEKSTNRSSQTRHLRKPSIIMEENELYDTNDNMTSPPGQSDDVLVVEENDLYETNETGLTAAST